MDNGFKNKLIIIGVIAALIMIGYYIMSPYQNCVRGGLASAYCAQHTNW